MGLLRTAARVGVASSVHGRVQRRQQQRWAAPAPAAAAPPPAAPPAPVAPPAPAAPAGPAGTNEMLAQLTQLGGLRAAGVLTEEEFAAQKSRILAG